MSPADLFVDELAKRVAKLVLDGLRAGSDAEWVDQHASALGPRRHAAAVRRRLGAGEGGAAQVGRRFLLTPQAVSEELGRPARVKKAADSDGSALAAELGLRLVGGKP